MTPYRLTRRSFLFPSQSSPLHIPYIRYTTSFFSYLTAVLVWFLVHGCETASLISTLTSKETKAYNLINTPFHGTIDATQVLIYSANLPDRRSTVADNLRATQREQPFNLVPNITVICLINRPPFLIVSSFVSTTYTTKMLTYYYPISWEGFYKTTPYYQRKGYVSITSVFLLDPLKKNKHIP